MTLYKMFYIHYINYAVPRNLNNSYSLGFVLSILFFLQTITGFFLVTFYIPHEETAFQAVSFIMKDVSAGWWLRYFHMNGSSFIFIILYLHLAKNLYYSSFSKNSKFVWLSGYILFILSVVTSFLGYVLPYGQMSFWGATVITQLVSIIPFIGDRLVIYLWGGFQVNTSTLGRILSLHYLLPFLILALIIVHIFTMHCYIINTPNRWNSKHLLKDYKNINLFPYYINKDLCCFIIFLSFMLYFTAFCPEYFFNTVNYFEANPIKTPKHITPEWYFLPFYGILKAIPSKPLGIFTMFVFISMPVVMLYLTEIFNILRPGVIVFYKTFFCAPFLSCALFSVYFWGNFGTPQSYVLLCYWVFKLAVGYLFILSLSIGGGYRAFLGFFYLFSTFIKFYTNILEIKNIHYTFIHRHEIILTLPSIWKTEVYYPLMWEALPRLSIFINFFYSNRFKDFYYQKWYHGISVLTLYSTVIFGGKGLIKYFLAKWLLWPNFIVVNFYYRDIEILWKLFAFIIVYLVLADCLLITVGKKAKYFNKFFSKKIFVKVFIVELRVSQGLEKGVGLIFKNIVGSYLFNIVRLMVINLLKNVKLNNNPLLIGLLFSIKFFIQYLITLFWWSFWLGLIVIIIYNKYFCTLLATKTESLILWVRLTPILFEKVLQSLNILYNYNAEKGSGLLTNTILDSAVFERFSDISYWTEHFFIFTHWSYFTYHYPSMPISWPKGYAYYAYNIIDFSITAYIQNIFLNILYFAMKFFNWLFKIMGSVEKGVLFLIKYPSYYLTLFLNESNYYSQVHNYFFKNLSTTLLLHYRILFEIKLSIIFDAFTHMYLFFNMRFLSLLYFKKYIMYVDYRGALVPCKNVRLPGYYSYYNWLTELSCTKAVLYLRVFDFFHIHGRGMKGIYMTDLLRMQTKLIYQLTPFVYYIEKFVILVDFFLKMLHLFVFYYYILFLFISHEFLFYLLLRIRELSYLIPVEKGWSNIFIVILGFAVIFKLFRGTFKRFGEVFFNYMTYLSQTRKTLLLYRLNFCVISGFTSFFYTTDYKLFFGLFVANFIYLADMGYWPTTAFVYNYGGPFIFFFITGWLFLLKSEK